MSKVKNIVLSLTVMSVMSVITGCGGSSDGGTGNETGYKTAGWYGKTQISATAPDDTVYTHNTAGIFGELLESTEAKDSNDIPGHGTALLQVVFPQTTWGEDNGDYFSNYQSFIEGESPKRIWTFQIKNQKTVDLKDASIKITLDGVYDVTYLEENGRTRYKESTALNPDRTKMLTLVDVDNHTSYAPSELKTANLNMDGLHVRTFRWVKGEVEENDYAPLNVVAPALSAKVSVEDPQSVFKEALQEAAIGFGQPPKSR